MTDLRKILNEATPGPWEIDFHGEDNCLGDIWRRSQAWHGYDDRICTYATAEDARLIALAPSIAAALLVAEKALRKIRDDNGDQECCGIGRGSPPECCGQPIDGFDRARDIASAALSEIRALTGGNDD